jgi:hypothetical protein
MTGPGAGSSASRPGRCFGPGDGGGVDGVPDIWVEPARTDE